MLKITVFLHSLRNINSDNVSLIFLQQKCAGLFCRETITENNPFSKLLTWISNSSDKALKVSVVNQTFTFINRRLLEITLTDILILKKNIITGHR